MFSNFKLLVFAALVAAVSANPAFRNLIVHEQRVAAPEGFVSKGAAPADQLLDMRIALVQGDMSTLEKRLYEVSTPGSSQYGKHLSKEEVEGFVKPPAESVSLVNEFLASYNVTADEISPTGDWLAFSVHISKANEMFGASYTVFEHEETGRQSLNTLEYSIPETLKGHLELVHPTVSFATPHALAPIFSSPITPSAIASNISSEAGSGGCARGITPACLQSIYGIPTNSATESSNVLGVSGFLGQFANQADLSSFLTVFRSDLSDSTFTLQTLDGGSNSGPAGLEANLDIQYTVGVASGVPTTFISVGGANHDGLSGFLDIMNFLLQQDKPPTVLTTSYGMNEAGISGSLANQLCNSIMQLGSRGTSVLFASGDGGVSGIHPPRGGSCPSNKFIPTFPSGCPFVTSVGGTTGTSPETGAALSGGGFSNIFSQPSYQSSAVSSYLSALGSTNQGRFNPKGRAFPDIAAQAHNLQVVVNGQVTPVDGTSCSSPIFASVIALLNDKLIAAGKSPLGFLNPFIYSEKGQAALNDIATGSNPGCGTRGFPAKAGWDPVTGFGTPNFAKLTSAVGL